MWDKTKIKQSYSSLVNSYCIFIATVHMTFLCNDRIHWRWSETLPNIKHIKYFNQNPDFTVSKFLSLLTCGRRGLEVNIIMTLSVMETCLWMPPYHRTKKKILSIKLIKFVPYVFVPKITLLCIWKVGEPKEFVQRVDWNAWWLMFVTDLIRE